MEINRDFYVDQLLLKRNNGQVKVITGIRRCGKSYLLNRIFYRKLIENGVRKDHIIRFAFDSIEDLCKIGVPPSVLDNKAGKIPAEQFLNYIDNQLVDDDNYYLLLDEVQLLESFEYVLISFLRKFNVDVYVTGSNAKFLSKDVITEFAGRGDELRLFPLSFSEFITVSSDDKYDSLTQYLTYGGIPQVALCQTEAEKKQILSGLFRETYLQDIKKRNNLRHIGELEDLLQTLSSSVGSLTNPEKLKNAFHSEKKSNISAATIQRYINGLEDAFLIESALRYDIRGKQYIGTPKKYYFEDLGLRNTGLSFRQYEPSHLLENALFIELLRLGYAVDIGVVEISEKNAADKIIRKQLEIDFVCSLDSNRYYIQSAYSVPDEKKREQEIRPFTKVDDSFKKILIIGDNTPAHFDDNGIFNVSVYDFLLNHIGF